jgi:beta-ureidopropionase / N-carbamoyl-L-amino-acid hydrolase
VLDGLRVDGERLRGRLATLAEIGDTGDGGNCRLALTDADKAGRDLVVEWMEALGLEVRIDAIGNVVGRRAGREDLAPVMTGSHIDTVATGGRYDGSLGVLGGLEVVETLNDAGVVTRRPIEVAFFTNEEGARFSPDMLGSMTYAGGLPLEEALDRTDPDGIVLGDELDRIGYRGTMPVPGPVPHAFVELHIEQGPVLERRGHTIGAVTGVQGISWQELTIRGQANHAGTTPMAMRHDAGFAAGALTQRVRDLVTEMGGAQVGTVGVIDVDPGLTNVVARRARMTVDLRNTDEALLAEAECRLADHVREVAEAEGVTVDSRATARFEPVTFDARVIDLVEATAERLGHSVQRLPAGAGHDAGLIAGVCPAGMVFTPSHEGISHNPTEHTDPEDLDAGADVLLQVLLTLAEEDPP